VRLDRFAPYFRDPAGHGMANPRPHRAFRYVYPFPDQALAQLAYYYEYDYTDGRTLDYVAPLVKAIETWHDLAGSVTLRAFDRPDGVLILTDTRPCATALQQRMAGLERLLYLHCDTGRSLASLCRFAAEQPGSYKVEEADVRGVLDRWMAARIAVELDGRFLALATG
jgi:hypothetical protein